MSPSRLARFLLSSVVLHTLWLLLSSCLVSASSRALTPVLSPPDQWTTNMGVSISSGSTATATISFSTVNEDWNTLSITAYGRTVDGRFASWTLQVDGSITTYTSPNQSPVQIPISGNHGYSVVLSAGPDAYGLMIIAIMVSGSSIPAIGATTSAAVAATPSTTTRMQEPLMTSSPTAIATTTTNILAGVNTTFTSGGTVLILTDSNSSSPTSTPASLLTLDDPLLHAPSNSVSLTNPSPSFNASHANLAESSGQPNYSTIVGAVFGSLAAVAICFLLAFMLYRRRQRKRIPPSTAFMNYRSTTEHPPQYYFHKDRTPFKDVLTTTPRNNRAGIGAGGGGFLTVMNRGRALSPLVEKSAEGSMNTHSPSPYPGMTANDNATIGSAAGAAAVGGGDRFPSLDSSIDAGIARTISPPSSAEPTAQTFQLAPAITRSERNSNAYDGMEEDMAHMPNPFDDHASGSPGRRDGEYGFGRAL